MNDAYNKFLVVLPSLTTRQKDVVLNYYDELRASNAALEADLAELKLGEADVKLAFEQRDQFRERIAALEARCRELEAEVSAGRKIYDQYRQGTRNAYECNVKLAEALREIAEHGDAYAKHEAQKALGLTVETEAKCKACGEPWPDYLTAKGPHGCQCHWDDNPDEGFKHYWRTGCGNHGSREGYKTIPAKCPHCERPTSNRGVAK